MPRYARKVIGHDSQGNPVYGGHVKKGKYVGPGKRYILPKTREAKAQEKFSDIRRYEEGVGLYGQILKLLEYVTGQEAKEVKHYEELQEEGEISDKQAYKFIAKSAEDFKKRRGKLEKVLLDIEKIAAVIILAIATFSLVNSVVDNPSITGYSILGVSQATTSTLILNVLAFIFVLLLVYPSGDLFLPIKGKEVRNSRKTIRKKRK